MENTSQSLELEDVEVDLDDNSLTVIPIPGTIKSCNTVSLVVGKVGAGVGVGVGDGARARVEDGAGAGDGSGLSEKG
jgi:uncharacterized spore protein YtfJ